MKTLLPSAAGRKAWRTPEKGPAFAASPASAQHLSVPTWLTAPLCRAQLQPSSLAAAPRSVLSSRGRERICLFTQQIAQPGTKPKEWGAQTSPGFVGYRAAAVFSQLLHRNGRKPNPLNLPLIPSCCHNPQNGPFTANRART